MNTEHLESNFERFAVRGYNMVGNVEHHLVRDGGLKWSAATFRRVDTVRKEIVLTLWDVPGEQTLIVDYIMTDCEKGKVIDKYNTEFLLESFVGEWCDLEDEVEAWIKECDDKEPTELATEPRGNRCHDNDCVLKLENLYSETDAMLTAKMMNEYGLYFVTTVEDENPDLRRRPPFTADDIVGWFDEAIRIVQKRHEENNSECETQYESEYVNGPIYITATRDGIVCLNVNLFSHTGK